MGREVGEPYGFEAQHVVLVGDQGDRARQRTAVHKRLQHRGHARRGRAAARPYPQEQDPASARGQQQYGEPHAVQDDSGHAEPLFRGGVGWPAAHAADGRASAPRMTRGRATAEHFAMTTGQPMNQPRWPRRSVSGKPHNLRVLLEFPEHLLTKWIGDLSIDFGVLDVAVAQVVSHILNAAAGF